MVLSQYSRKNFCLAASQGSQRNIDWILLELSWIDAYLYRRSRQHVFDKEEKTARKSLSVYSYPAVSENTSPIP